MKFKIYIYIYIKLLKKNFKKKPYELGLLLLMPSIFNDFNAE